jgi:23S rRNA (guanosine2251-2'-O)-methyltransferase
MTKKQFQPNRSTQVPNRLWIWGIHACHAALANPKRRCFRLLMNESNAKELSLQTTSLSCKADILDSPSLSRLLPEGAVHQGIAMEVAPLPELSLLDLRHQEVGVLVVLDQVTDPHNVGAIIRTAMALGALGIIMTDRNAPPLSGVLAKAASGALELLPLWQVTNLARTLDELKQEGFWTVGLDERAPKTLSKTVLPPQTRPCYGSRGRGTPSPHPRKM